MKANGIPVASALATWRKSSYSGSENGNCVEVAVTGGTVAMRDSKDRSRPALEVTEHGWRAFIAATVDGTLSA